MSEITSDNPAAKPSHEAAGVTRLRQSLEAESRRLEASEAFDPDPFIERMPGYDFPWGLKEMG